jgi:hypothetical protein
MVLKIDIDAYVQWQWNLAHGGGNALDRTVPHVAGMRTDVAGPCAHHSNQVTAALLGRFGRR